MKNVLTEPNFVTVQYIFLIKCHPYDLKDIIVWSQSLATRLSQINQQIPACICRIQHISIDYFKVGIFDFVTTPSRLGLVHSPREGKGKFHGL